MSPEDDERRLRAALAEAHRRDAETTPPFARVWAGDRSPASQPAIRWGVVSAGVAAVATVLLVWLARTPPSSVAFPTGTRWVAPTDFLLETPDLVTLRTLPALDPARDPDLHFPDDGRKLR